MKRIQSVLTIFFALFVALAAFSFRAEAAGGVYDQAKLLSQSELEKLTAEIQRIEKKHNVRIGIVTQSSLQGRPVDQVAPALLQQGISGAPNGGILLLVCMEPRKWAIARDDTIKVRITNEGGRQYLENEMLPKLKENKFGEAFLKYVAAIEKELDYYAAEGKPYDPSSEFSVLAAIIALALGGLGGYGVREMLISSMSNVTPAARASEYLVDDSFDLTESDDRFLFMNVTRTKKTKSSSRSSGGGNVSSGSF